MQTRRQFLRQAAIAGTSSILSGCAAANRNGPRSRPNIVFIMADDHAAHAMSCYASRINQTPNLDRIAREGVRFTNCFCTNSICAPSRVSILTGKYSHINGVINNAVAMDSSQDTFPKLLQANGYATAVIGKWHAKSDPVGFDYWSVLPGQGEYHNPEFIEMGKRTRYRGYVTDIITDKCLDWLKNRQPDKPFCLLYHHKAPHRPWEPDDKHAKLYEDIDIPIPETFDDDGSGHGPAAMQQEMTIEHHLVDRDLKVQPPAGLSGPELKKWKYQRYIKDYLRCIASIDDNVGRFLDYLDEAGLSENTIVIYTSDQGFFLGDHGWFDKRFMYEESLRMPLLVRWPGHVKSGSLNTDIVLNIDFAPTLLDVAGVRVPPDVQGRSLTPLLACRPPADWRRSMYYHYYEYPGWHMVKRHYGIRTQRYKLIHFYYDIDAWELYDLVDDPDELRNIYGESASAGTVTQLKAELARLQKLYGDSDELAWRFVREGPPGDMPADWQKRVPAAK